MQAIVPATTRYDGLRYGHPTFTLTDAEKANLEHRLQSIAPVEFGPL